MLNMFPILFFCCSCMTSSLSLDEQIAYRVMGEFSKSMQVRGLYAVGYGLKGDKSNNKLGVLDICFQTNQQLNIESARKLIVENVNHFVIFLNDNKKLKTYLTVFPATSKQISFSIRGKERLDNNPNYVEMAYTYENNIAYFTDSVAPPTHGLIHKETFEEAVAQLQNVKK